MRTNLIQDSCDEVAIADIHESIREVTRNEDNGRYYGGEARDDEPECSENISGGRGDLHTHQH